MTAEPTTKPPRPRRGRRLAPPPEPRRRQEDGPRGPCWWRAGCRATPGAARWARCSSAARSLTPSLLPRGWVMQGLIAGHHRRDRLRRGRRPSRGSSRSSPTAGCRPASAAAPGRCWPWSGRCSAVVMLWLGAGWQRRHPRADGPGRAARATPRSASSSWRCWCSRSSSRIGRGIRWLGPLAGPAVRPVSCRGALARPLGVVVVTALVIFLLNGVLFQGLVERDELRVQRQGRRHRGGRGRARRRPSGRAARRPWCRGTTWACRGATSSGRGRRPTELDGVLRPAGAGAGPRLRRAGVSAEDVGDRAALAVRELRAGRRLRPVGARGRDDDRDRLGGPGGERLAGVRVQRRHRDGGDAVLLPAQLDVVPGRPGQGAGRRPRAVRRGLRRLGAAAAATRARSSTSSGRASAPSAGRPRSAAWPTSRTARTACCGPGRRTSTRCGASIVADREPGSPEWLPVVDDGRTVRFADEAPDLGQAAGALGRAAGRLPAERVGPDRLVVAAADPRPPRLAARRARARRLPEHGVAAVRHVLAGHRRPGVRRSACPTATGTSTQADYVNGWADVAQPPGWTAADTERLRP